MQNKGRGFIKPGLGTLAVVMLLGWSARELTLDWLGDEIAPAKPSHQVLALPAGYQPSQAKAPYPGPHPAFNPLDLSAFSLPVAIGDTGPVDTQLWPLDYPFACATEDSGLGQPLVDNQQGAGTLVTSADGEALGFSQDCQIATRVDYFYLQEGAEQPVPLPPGALPTDAQNDAQGPVIVRVERGSLNRYLYGIAMRVMPQEPINSAKLWNHKVIFAFKGGVGIGKYQGKLRLSDLTEDNLTLLKAGYAILASSGNVTSTHYHLWRGARTAQLVKAQFVARYGEPRWTIGIGGSGGAVQQYIFAEIAPGLLNGLLPQYSYPDMVTQSIWALDCELLEYYFDELGGPRWQVQTERPLVEGLTASNSQGHRFRRMDDWSRWLNFKPSRLPPGATECSASWRGLTPLTNNPRYYHRAPLFSDALAAQSHFSYWHDLGDIYGQDAAGYANRTFDNIGVQYGLEALKEGALSPAEFLHLNAHIGGWKPPAQMQQERFWVLSGDQKLRRLSLWGDHNMQKRPGGLLPLAAFNGPVPAGFEPAPRNQGHPQAMAAAYLGGQVFLGRLTLPTIDLRHYLDPVLNMHHSFASLSVRERLLRQQGNSDNLVIWVAAKPFDPTPQALRAMEQWLESGRRPVSDSCFDGEGKVLASGDTVWNGRWNQQADGPCMAIYPAHSSPRNRAGSPLAGDLFKCARVSVQDAVAQGFYGTKEMAPYQSWLEAIFPDGVCDYRQGDVARPSGLAMGF